jgi:hypothetical protein
MPWRIVTISGYGLPRGFGGVDREGYDTRFAADSMAEQFHEGTYRIEKYRSGRSRKPLTVPHGGEGSPGRRPAFQKKFRGGTHWLVRWSPSHDEVMVRAKTKIEAIEKAWSRKKPGDQISSVNEWSGRPPAEYEVIR